RADAPHQARRCHFSRHAHRAVRQAPERLGTLVMLRLQAGRRADRTPSRSAILPVGSRINLLEDRGGAAYVEFLLAFIPLFFLFLGMVQMALMYAGDLVVQHSATTAARAAAVVIDDDPRYYGGAERMTVSSFGVTSTEDALGTLISIFGGGGGGGSTGIGSSPGGPR